MKQYIFSLDAQERSPLQSEKSKLFASYVEGSIDYSEQSELRVKQAAFTKAMEYRLLDVALYKDADEGVELNGLKTRPSLRLRPVPKIVSLILLVLCIFSRQPPSLLRSLQNGPN